MARMRPILNYLSSFWILSKSTHINNKSYSTGFIAAMQPERVMEASLLSQTVETHQSSDRQETPHLSITAA